MNVAYEKTILDIINDFDEFIDELTIRKDELRELKDGLLIYNDPEFMKSIKNGCEEAKYGAIVVCKDMEEMKNLFESL